MKAVKVYLFIGLVGLGLACATPRADAQEYQWGSGDHSWTNDMSMMTNFFQMWTNRYVWWTNHQFSYSNFIQWSNHFAWGTNQWWTNFTRFTNCLPGFWTNIHSRVIAPDKPAPPPAPGLPPRVNQPQFPVDVQALVNQFQEQRKALISQLKATSDADRDRILGQLRDMREQFRQQMADLRQQAKEQAEQMKDKLGSLGNAAGAGAVSAGGSRVNKPGR